MVSGSVGVLWFSQLQLPPLLRRGVLRCQGLASRRAQLLELGPAWMAVGCRRVLQACFAGERRVFLVAQSRTRGHSAYASRDTATGAEEPPGQDRAPAKAWFLMTDILGDARAVRVLIRKDLVELAETCLCDLSSDCSRWYTKYRSVVKVGG